MPPLVMKVYVIKIAVRGVSPMVWRRLRIAVDTSLAALHFIIQIIQGWGDDHLYQFHIYGKDYGITYEGGIGFPDNPFQVVIDDFEFDVGDLFTHEYNFFEHWIHDIRVEAIYENTELKTPFCISGHGMPGATVADEARGEKTGRPCADIKKVQEIDELRSRGVRLACDHAGLGVSTYYKLRNHMKNQ